MHELWPILRMLCCYQFHSIPDCWIWLGDGRSKHNGGDICARSCICLHQRGTSSLSFFCPLTTCLVIFISSHPSCPVPSVLVLPGGPCVHRRYHHVWLLRHRDDQPRHSAERMGNRGRFVSCRWLTPCPYLNYSIMSISELFNLFIFMQNGTDFWIGRNSWGTSSHLMWFHCALRLIFTFACVFLWSFHLHS